MASHSVVTLSLMHGWSLLGLLQRQVLAALQLGGERGDERTKMGAAGAANQIRRWVRDAVCRVVAMSCARAELLLQLVPAAAAGRRSAGWVSHAGLPLAGPSLLLCFTTQGLRLALITAISCS